jgi:hypothetical protein
VAAIYGAERVSRWNKKYSAKDLTNLVFMASFISCYILAPLPLPGAANHWKPTHFLNLPDPGVLTIRSLMDEETSVSAQSNIGSHFSQRWEIYRYPNKAGEVDVIILRLESPTANINNLHDGLKDPRRNVLKMLDSHLQMDRTDYIASIERLLAGKKYGILFWNDPWLVMKKGVVNNGSGPVQEIEHKLKLLCQEWEIKFEG